MSGRCRACDSCLNPDEIIWIPDRMTHENLCKVCRHIIHEALVSSSLEASTIDLSNGEDEDSEDESLDSTDEQVWTD